MTDAPRGFMATLRRLLGRKGPRRPSSYIQAAPDWKLPGNLPDVKYLKNEASRRSGLGKAQPRTSPRKLIVAVTGILLALALGSFIVVRLMWQTTLPEELWGTWRTDEPRYATRRLELLRDQVLFQVGDTAIATVRYPIVRVRRSRSARGALYRVRYLGEDGDNEFRFIYEPGPPAMVRLANQSEFAWTRTGPPSPRPQLGL